MSMKKQWDNQLNLQLILKLITVVIARGTTEENNIKNFGNPVQPMLPTSVELHIALMSNFIKIHFQLKYIEQHMDFVIQYDYLTCLIASDFKLPLNAWVILLDDVWLQAPPEWMSESLRQYLHHLLKFFVTTRITTMSYTLLIINIDLYQHADLIDIRSYYLFVPAASAISSSLTFSRE